MADEFDVRKFDSLPSEGKVDYLVSNFRGIPKDQADRAISILVEAGQIEYAATLARDYGMVDRAIEMLVEAGDYLWAALMARKAGLKDEALRIYKQGLGFYIDRRMWGHAVAVATALRFPQDEIDALYMKGLIERGGDAGAEMARGLADTAATNLEISVASLSRGADDDAIEALREYRARQMRAKAIEWPPEAAGQTAGVSQEAGSAAAGEADTAWKEPRAEAGQAGSFGGTSQISQASAEGSRGGESGTESGYEAYSMWRGGSDRGMRSAEGTGRIDRPSGLPDQGGS